MGTRNVTQTLTFVSLPVGWCEERENNMPWLVRYALSMVAGYSSCYALTHCGAWCDRAKCRIAVADALFGVAYYPFLFSLAAHATASLHSSIASRWTLATWSSVVLGKLLASRMVVHIPIIYLRRTDASNRTLYLCHHLMVILVYGAGVVRQRAHFWGSLAALCELTNVFLTIDELFSYTAGEKSASFVADCNRVGFALSYVFARLALFPVSLFYIARDLYIMPRENRSELGNFELVVYPAAYVAVFLLSLAWAKTILTESRRILLQRFGGQKDRQS